MLVAAVDETVEVRQPQKLFSQRLIVGKAVHQGMKPAGVVLTVRLKLIQPPLLLLHQIHQQLNGIVL